VSSRAESAQPRDPGSFSFAACPCHLPSTEPLPILPLPVSGEAAPPARVRDPKCRDSECAADQSGLDGDLAVTAQSGVDGDSAVTAHSLSFRAFSPVSSRPESALLSSRAESAQPRDPGSSSFAAAQSGLDGDLAVTAHSPSFCAISLVSSRPESALVSSRAESAQPRGPGSFSFAACPCHLPVRESQFPRFSTPPSPHCSEGAGAGPCSLANE
jgi:hypothetical protein